MARSKDNGYREQWWEERISSAPTCRGKVMVLQNKILADVAKLPEDHQEEAFALVIDQLTNALDEIAIKSIELEWSA